MSEMYASAPEWILESNKTGMNNAVRDVFFSRDHKKYAISPLVTSETRDRIIEQEDVGTIRAVLLAYRNDKDWDIEIESLNDIDMDRNELGSLFRDLTRLLATQKIRAEVGRIALNTYEEGFDCLGGVVLYENQENSSSFAALVIPTIYKKLNYLYDFTEKPELNNDPEIGSSIFTASLISHYINEKYDIEE